MHTRVPTSDRQTANLLTHSWDIGFLQPIFLFHHCPLASTAQPCCCRCLSVCLFVCLFPACVVCVHVCVCVCVCVWGGGGHPSSVSLSSSAAERAVDCHIRDARIIIYTLNFGLTTQVNGVNFDLWPVSPIAPVIMLDCASTACHFSGPRDASHAVLNSDTCTHDWGQEPSCFRKVACYEQAIDRECSSKCKYLTLKSMEEPYIPYSGVGGVTSLCIPVQKLPQKEKEWACDPHWSFTATWAQNLRYSCVTACPLEVVNLENRMDVCVIELHFEIVLFFFFCLALIRNALQQLQRAIQRSVSSVPPAR